MYDLDQMVIFCFPHDLCHDLFLEGFSQGAWFFNYLIIDDGSYWNLIVFNFTEPFHRIVLPITIKSEFRVGSKSRNLTLDLIMEVS